MITDSHLFTVCIHVQNLCYTRISTLEQTPENQLQEIEAVGFKVKLHCVFEETVSGSVAIARRKGFNRLLDKMERDDVLIVTKLDRLGRDAIDVSTTVVRLENIGIRVHCLVLGGVELTSSAGKLTMGVINAVAQFERDLLIERTQSGLARAKARGKPLGRSAALTTDQQAEVRARIAAGATISAIARDICTIRQTIMRARDARKT